MVHKVIPDLESAKKFSSGLKGKNTAIRKLGLIDPESEIMSAWDTFIVVLLVFTAFGTPYEVAFLKSKVDFLFFFNRGIDLCFLIDMFLNFLLPYKVGDRWVTSRKYIAMNYFQTWFFIDLVSIFPFDIIGLVVDSSTSNMKVLRVVRCMRLFKLIRLLKTSSTIQKFIRHYGIQNSTVSLLNFAIAVVVISHWLSCAWMLIPKVEGAETDWVTKYYGLEVGEPWPPNEELYLTCMYWAVMTLTTIGYGDVTASTSGEMLLAVFGMGVGASVYAYIVGAICGILNSRDPLKTKFNNLMDALNSLMANNGLPQDMRESLRDFLYRSQVVFREEADHQVMGALSPGLQKTVYGYIHQSWIEKVATFKNLPQDERTLFIAEMATVMELKAYAKGEYIIKLSDSLDSLRVVKEGVIRKLVPHRVLSDDMVMSKNVTNVVGGVPCSLKLLSRGAVLGSEVVARGAGFRCRYHIQASTFCILSELMRTDLKRILSHPKLACTKRAFRMQGLKTLMQQDFIEYCQVFRSVFGVQSVFDERQHAFLASRLQNIAGQNLTSVEYVMEIRNIKREAHTHKSIKLPKLKRNQQQVRPNMGDREASKSATQNQPMATIADLQAMEQRILAALGTVLANAHIEAEAEATIPVREQIGPIQRRKELSL